MTTCCLPECEAPVFIRFKSPDLGDREYPICREHMKEHSEDMDLFKQLLKALTFESDVIPRNPEPEPGEPTPEEPEDENLEDWEQAMFT